MWRSMLKRWIVNALAKAFVNGEALAASDPPRMQPLAAENWELPRLETTGELASWLEVSVAELEWFADLKGLGRKKAEARLRHYSSRVLRWDPGSVRLI
jgi:hypothetical protein